MTTPITTRDLAHLVAFKARLKDADEAVLLGIERALVEIVYLVRQDAAEQIEGRGLSPGDLRTLAAVEHLVRANKVRAELHGHLIERDGKLTPFTEEVFPPDDSKLQLALAFRETRLLYEEARARWRKLGWKAGHEADLSLLSAPLQKGKARDDEDSD